jgi:sec-independent protein translocase protein TatC
MTSILPGLWAIITWPFRALWWLISLPFRGVKRARTFLNEEPEDQPITDALTATLKQPSTLFEHLDALRKHLLRMVFALILGIGICATFTSQIINLLAQPVGGLDKLQAIDPTETIGVFMRVALWGGFAIALPYIAFELWLFAAPGLHARARKMGLLGIPLTLIFFIGGMGFTYFMLLPSALNFLLHFLGINTIPRISTYINFVTGLLFWIGIAFEFPLVIYIVSFMGFIKPRFLAKQWRYAIIIIAIIAAAITPTVDPVNMSLVMGPMILLYFVSIILSYMAVGARRGDKSKVD